MVDLANKPNFNFELVSPERRVISEPARMVTIPGTEGEFGVLAGHMPLIATVKAGVVEIIAANDAAPRRVFIAGGFADVNADSCTVLAEEAVDVAKLDAAALDRQAANLREDLARTTDDVAKARAARQLDVVLAKLAAIKGPSAS